MYRIKFWIQTQTNFFPGSRLGPDPWPKPKCPLTSTFDKTRMWFNAYLTAFWVLANKERAGHRNLIKKRRPIRRIKLALHQLGQQRVLLELQQKTLQRLVLACILSMTSIRSDCGRIDSRVVSSFVAVAACQRWVIAILKKNQLPTTLPITSILSSWHYQLK